MWSTYYILLWFHLFPFLGVDSDLLLQDIHEEPPPEELREEQFTPPTGFRGVSRSPFLGSIEIKNQGAGEGWKKLNDVNMIAVLRRFFHDYHDFPI